MADPAVFVPAYRKQVRTSGLLSEVRTGEAVMRGLIYDHYLDVQKCEMWMSGDTHLALEYIVVNSVVCSTTPGSLTIATAGTGVATASITTRTKCFRRADKPRMDGHVTLTEITACLHDIGFYKDANEYAMLTYNVATDPNWQMIIDDASGADTLDTGVAASTDKIFVEIEIATDGTVYLWIDGISIDIAHTAAGAVANKVSADGMFWKASATEAAAAAKTSTIGAVTYGQRK